MQNAIKLVKNQNELDRFKHKPDFFGTLMVLFTYFTAPYIGKLKEVSLQPNFFNYLIVFSFALAVSSVRSFFKNFFERSLFCVFKILFIGNSNMLVTGKLKFKIKDHRISTKTEFAIPNLQVFLKKYMDHFWSKFARL